MFVLRLAEGMQVPGPELGYRELRGTLNPSCSRRGLNPGRQDAMVQVHFLLLPTRQLSEHSVHRPGPQRGGSRQVVEEGRGRGTGRWQRRANKVGLGTSRLYPDEGGVCVCLHSKEFQGKGTMGSEISGRKGQLC